MFFTNPESTNLRNILSKFYVSFFRGLHTVGGVEVQFHATERPQLFEFGVATCRTCRLRSKKAILEVATLICKNDKALRKTGVLACPFDNPL